MPRVIISAGHTTSDPGTIANGLKEVELTRIIARKVVPYLRSNGIITLSVPPNMELARRIEWINSTGYSANFKDIALEIHINDGGKSGFEIWHKDDAANDSKNLADSIMSSVTSETGLPSQGAKSETEHEFGSLAFISNTSTISVLLECLYIDNPEDAQKLKSEIELEKIAKGIAKGVVSFLGLKYNDAPAVSSVINQVPVVNQQISNPVVTAPVYQPPQTFPPQQNLNTFSSAPMVPQAPVMSREERKDMIVKTYKRILGREPNQNDLNYFLNIGIAEDKLVQRMVSSQEHLDIIKTKGEYDKLLANYEKLKMEATRLKAENTDNQAMIKNMTQLIHQKNRNLSEMRYRISQSTNSSTPQAASTIQKRKYKGSISDRFFHFFSNILG